MKNISLYLLSALITACSVSKEPSHSAAYSLERPPTFPETNVANESRESDKSSISERNFNNGLPNDVYRNEDHDQVLWIKRPVDEAWVLLGKAIRLNELEITGKNQKQGGYEVEYKADSIFGGFNLFGSGTPSKYLLKLESQNNETKLSVSKKEDDDKFDESILKDGAPEYSNDNSSKLTDLLFDTLQKNVSN